MPNKGRLNDDQRARVVELYRDGHSLQEVARRLGSSRPTVTAVLDDHGIARRRTQATPELEAKILDEHRRQPEAVAWRIGQAVGCSKSVVYRVLRDHDIRRPRGNAFKLNALQRTQVARLYAKGWTMARLARRFEVGEMTVHKVLKLAGVASRRACPPFLSLPPRVERRLIALYRQGFSVRYIAAVLGHGSAPLMRILKERKVPMRKGYPRYRTGAVPIARGRIRRAARRATQAARRGR